MFNRQKLFEQDSIVKSIIRDHGKAPCLIMINERTTVRTKTLKHKNCSGQSIVGIDKTFNLCDMHGWGAGSQLPFTSRIPVNGGWSSWSAFKECSVTCGGGKQSQYRSCNNPATANGGTDCVGDGVNSVSCNEHPCPVNGKFSDWGQWSSCIVNSGCQGYREGKGHAILQLLNMGEYTALVQ
ncbi:unnamed protein product [Mytilus edulis]|uniref:Uncharacterized protein n=1 Tax=Mytilus edulis TaxID=6550 RepID=A0A8S3QIN5_MYTED|nr:unnamed protein product [Mytilus edulis]